MKRQVPEPAGEWSVLTQYYGGLNNYQYYFMGVPYSSYRRFYPKPFSHYSGPYTTCQAPCPFDSYFKVEAMYISVQARSLLSFCQRAEFQLKYNRDL